jgi:hypothetical protein
LNTLGGSWSAHVREASRQWTDRFDTVVISGNPFYYFDLGSFFRDLWDCKVILDFRDPFAHNQRFTYTRDQRNRLIELEDWMVANADAVISVNSQCLREIAPGIDVKRQVVSNGFDETIVEEVDSRPSAASKVSKTRVVYTGTVFPTLPLGNVLDALPTDQYEFQHFGRDYSASQATKSHPVSTARGIVSYRDLIRELKSVDAGIIMTSGESSTQTTKLFDYLACDLDVIIVTQGVVKTGDLHEITRELAGIYWVEDKPSELRRFFATYQPSRATRPERLRYSRRHQAGRLLDLVLELEKS